MADQRKQETKAAGHVMRLVKGVLLLGVLCLTGCASQTGTDAAEEPVELQVVYSSYAGIPEDLHLVQDKLNELLSARINCTVKLEVYPNSNYDTQINLLLSGGDPIDLMTSGLNTRYHQIVSKRLVLPMDELLAEYGQGIMEAAGADLEASRINGKLYGVTGVPLTAAADSGFAVKREILEELNMDIDSIKTLEDVEEALRTIKAAYTDMTPLIPSSSGRAYDDINNLSWRAAGLESLEDGCVVDYETMTVRNMYQTEEFRDVVEFLRRMNQDGLIMPNASTNNDSRAALLNGGQGVAYVTTSYCPTLSVKENRQLGVEITELDQQKVVTTNSFTNTQWMIPVKSKHPEEAMQFLNLLYTDPEVGNLLQYGIEGIHYVKTAEENVIAYPEGQDASNSRYYVKTPGITDINPGCYVIEPLPADVYRQYEDFKGTFQRSPLLGFMFDVSECKTEVAAIANVVSQYHFSFMSGDYDSPVLDEMNEKLKKAGIDRVIEIKQKQLDAWLAENK